MLGGAATHFALAASFFDEVRPVGPGRRRLQATRSSPILATRGTNVDDVERVAGGKTFFWEGEYGWDLNSRETHRHAAQRVRALPAEALGGCAAPCDVLFLANIQPQLQLDVLDACDGPRFTAMDSMNLWIDIAREPLVKVIERVDCVILNDAELRQLTEKPNLISGGSRGPVLGPVGRSSPSRASTAPRS